MATPMSAQQIELQRKKNNNIPPTSAANQAIYNTLKPMAATPKPSTGGVVPPTAAKPLTPMAATPQAAQTKPGGVVPNMPQTAKPVTGTPMSASAAMPKASGGYAPLSSNIADVRNGNQLNQLASDQLAIERAGLQNATDSQIASLQNSAKYANQLIQDNRVLEDGNFARTNAPAAWDGSVGYRGAILDRGRQIDDTMRAADLVNAMNSAQKGLYDFDTNAAAKERGIANELLDTERRYGLDKTKTDQSVKESNLNAAILVGDQTGRVITPQNDWQGLIRQANNPNTPLNRAGKEQQYNEKSDQRDFEYTKGRDSVKDAQWETEFSRIASQDGIQNAIAWANQSLNREEFEDSSAYKWAGLDAELATAGAEGEKYQGMSANDVVSNVRKNFGDEDGILPTDNAVREQMYMQIIGAGLPGNQEDQALAAIGFTPDQIKKLDDKYLGK